MHPKHLDAISALRGIAALYVAILHLMLITNPAADAPAWLRPLVISGRSGVSLFFVISAFTLCLSMKARSDELSPLRNYYIRRFFRIAPLFYLWICVTFVRDIFVFNVVQPPLEIFRSMFFFFNFSPTDVQGFVWASWTIGVEMLFYLVFPAFFRWLNTITKAAASVVGALVVAVIWHHALGHFIHDKQLVETYYYFSLLHQLPVFMIGILAYRIHRAIDGMDEAQRRRVGFVCVTAFFITHFAIAYLTPMLTELDKFYVQAAAYGALVIGLVRAPLLVLVNSATVFMGEISYSIYLTHANVVYFMSRVFAVFYAHIPYKTGAFACSVITACAVFTPIAYLSYRVVEQPGIRFGKRLIGYLESARALKLARKGAA